MAEDKEKVIQDAIKEAQKAAEKEEKEAAKEAEKEAAEESDKKETKASEKNVKDNEAMPYGTEAEKALERRLENLLSEVGGVGRVKVMVTLDGTWESIYAKDSETKDVSEKDEYVTVKENGKNTGLKIRSVRPDIKGVGVSCEGADSAAVRENITSLICAALGIPSNRVYVAKAVGKTK